MIATRSILLVLVAAVACKTAERTSGPSARTGSAPPSVRAIRCARPGEDVLLDKWEDVAELRCSIDEDATVGVIVNGRDLHYDLGPALLRYSFETIPTGHLDYTAPDGRNLTILEPTDVARAWIHAVAIGKASHAGFAPTGKRDQVLVVPTADGERLLLSDTARPIRELALVAVAEDANKRLGENCAFGGRANAVTRVLFDAHVTALDVGTSKTITRDFPSMNACPNDPHTLTLGVIGGGALTIPEVRADADWNAVQTWLASLALPHQK